MKKWHKWFKGRRIPKSQMKAVLTTFFDITGIVHFEFSPQGQTVTRLAVWKY